MLRTIVALALAGGLAAPAALADTASPGTAPEQRLAPGMKRSPTDEYAPETRRAPRAHPAQKRVAATPRRVPARSVAGRSGETLTYSYLSTPPSLLAPGAGPAGGATRYYVAPVSPDFDGAPCPTRSRESLGELFACTLR